MGKASGKKKSPSQAAKPEAGTQARRHADKAAGRDIPLAYKPALHLLLISLLGFAIYSNTFQSPFQWDESDFIVANPIVRDLDYFRNPSLAEGLQAYDGLRSRYIGYLTFALNYKLHGFNVAGYHVVNLAIHIINAILVYFLVLLTLRTPFFGREKLDVKREKLGTRDQESKTDSLFTIHYSRFIALAVAMLFVSHPIQTEAVTYIFQRFASLVSMFYLMSLVLYIKGRLGAIAPLSVRGEEKGSVSPIDCRLSPIAYYSFSLFFAVCAMKTKENAFTLPLVIALYEFLFFSGPLKSRVLRLAPFLLTMLIVPLTIMGSGSTAGELISEIRDPDFMINQGQSGRDYLITQFRVVITYIRLLLLPVNQNLSYSYPLYHSMFDFPVFLSFLALASLLATAVYLLYKSESAWRKEHSVESSMPYAPYAMRLISFGIIWFFITLSVESSIIPIPMVIDEYRIYLPSVGFFIAITTAFLLMVNRVAEHRARRTGQSAELTSQGANSEEQREKNTMRLALGALLILVIALSSATYARNILWKDRVSLWEDVVRKSPGSPRANNNLGLAYAAKGLHEKAIEMYMKSISLNPSYMLAYTNLGIAYAAIGNTGLAIENFEKAIALDPNYGVAYANLARAYGDAGRIDKAAEYYARAVSLSPFDSKAYHGLGTAYVLLGRLDDALAAYTKFISLSPDDPEAYRSRGIVYAKKGDVRAAAADFQKSCSQGSKESCEYLKGERLR